MSFRRPTLYIALAIAGMAMAGEVFALSAPTIQVAPAQYYPLDEMLYIEGVARPHSAVELLFERSVGSPVRLTVKSNSNGEWFLGERLELAGGEWSVRARIADEGGISDWSNPRLIQSIISGFTLGSLRIRYMPTILTLLVILCSGLALFGYSIIRLRRIEKSARDMEAQKAKDELSGMQLERDFDKLRRSILEELGHLNQKRAGAGLTREEERHHERLLDELRECEKAITKRMKNIA